MKLLLFGGTFDPPHQGHINNLCAALALVQPDLALVMPAGTPPHKAASATPGALRLEMCRCFEEISPVVQCSDWEICQGGRSYTIQTLQMLHEKYPEARLYLSVGSDMLCSFTAWRDWQGILRLATLVVQSREDGDAAALHAAAAPLQAAGGTVLFATAPALHCASSEIRAGQYSPEELQTLLPQTVREVIEREGLYR